MKHILLSYDSLVQADRAFDIALDFTTKYQSDLTILAVARSSEPCQDVETETEFEAAERYYDLFNKLKIKSQSISIKNMNFVLKAGHPAEQIIYYAESNKVNHIVMRYRGNTYVISSPLKKIEMGQII